MLHQMSARNPTWHWLHASSSTTANDYNATNKCQHINRSALKVSSGKCENNQRKAIIKHTFSNTFHLSGESNEHGISARHFRFLYFKYFPYFLFGSQKNDFGITPFATHIFRWLEARQHERQDLLNALFVAISNAHRLWWQHEWAQYKGKVRTETGHVCECKASYQHV